MPVSKNDPFGPIKQEKGKGTPSPEEVKAFHERSDKDSSITAQHHTLGAKRNQASPGDHIHDGKGCRKIAEGKGESLTGTKTGIANATNVQTQINNLVTILQKYIDMTDART